MNKSLNIAILGDGFYGWGGGVELIYIIVKGLSVKSKTERINLFLLLPAEKIGDSKSKTENIYSSIINAVKSVNEEIKIIYYSNWFNNLSHQLKKYKVDVCLPSMNNLGKNFPIPWIAYIYDFQHKYYPDFFTSETCLNRDIYFATMLLNAKSLIVNAKAVKNDVNRFFPYHSCNVFNLPFAPVAQENWFSIQKNVKSIYKLPNRYFLISNQFWVHKSHITAFEAFSWLMNYKKNEDIHIVCTGKTEDHRFPNYFNELKQKNTDLGITDKVHFLGYIPKEDQVQIMRESIAVLQPTLFEGGPGGGSVYNAVALGVRAIISDIPVNLEIINDNISFFKARSSEDLMKKMIEILEQPYTAPQREQLLVQGECYAEKLGDMLLEAISSVLKQ